MITKIIHQFPRYKDAENCNGSDYEKYSKAKRPYIWTKYKPSLKEKYLEERETNEIRE